MEQGLAIQVTERMTSGISPDEEYQTSFDEMFDVLGHACRRWLLTQLSDVGAHDGVESLSEERILDNDILEPFMEEMFDTHLPMLTKARFIVWDENDRVIERGPRFDKIVPLLELIIEHEDELPDEWP